MAMQGFKGGENNTDVKLFHSFPVPSSVINCALSSFTAHAFAAVRALRLQSVRSKGYIRPTISSSMNTPSLPSPFFPDPSTLRAPPDPGQADRNLAKNVFEYVLVSFVIIVVVFLIFYRLRRLSQTNRPLSHFFRPSLFRRRSPTSTPPSAYSSSQNPVAVPSRSYFRSRLRPHYGDTTYQSPSLYDDVRYPITASRNLSPDLRDLPLSVLPYTYGYHVATRRTRAADVDEHGRRMDSGRDPDRLSLDDKEILPAYDRYGGPPKYMDLEMALDGGTMIDRLRREAEARDRDRITSLLVDGHNLAEGVGQEQREGQQN
ncbi:hypothetical protein APHAL10511_000297 [Amanita phalloides]|nr:hypothetical protein APHAL10511_000297 [Amanita phalloides]